MASSSPMTRRPARRSGRSRPRRRSSPRRFLTRANGRQYVTVLTGSGSQGGGILATGNAAYRTDYRLPRQVLTFAIDGTDTLPPFELPALVPPDDPDFTPDPERVKQGAMAFATNACLVCHGMNAIGGGSAPDLRYSPMIVDKDAFSQWSRKAR